MAEYNPSKIIKDGNTYNFRDTTKIPLSGSNAISGSLIPSTNGTVNLGTASLKWADVNTALLNGINPSALSLPNVSNDVIVVDTTNFTWNTGWSYTPLFDGWISVWIPASSAINRRFSVTQEYLRYWYPNQNGEIFRFSFPVVKDVSVGFGFISNIQEPAAPNIYLLKAQGNI